LFSSACNKPIDPPHWTVGNHRLILTLVQFLGQNDNTCTQAEEFIIHEGDDKWLALLPTQFYTVFCKATIMQQCPYSWLIGSTQPDLLINTGQKCNLLPVNGVD